jgi:hypothetical protein
MHTYRYTHLFPSPYPCLVPTLSPLLPPDIQAEELAEKKRLRAGDYDFLKNCRVLLTGLLTDRQYNQTLARFDGFIGAEKVRFLCTCVHTFIQNRIRVRTYAHNVYT